MLMLNFTDDVDLLLNDNEPTWSDETGEQVREHPVDVVGDRVDHAFAADPDHGGEADEWLGGLAFADGHEREYGGGFAVSGKEYNSGLADDLGCDIADDGAVVVDADRETSVSGVYAVGDLTPRPEPDAHRARRRGLRWHRAPQGPPTFPVDVDDLDRIDDLGVPAMPDDLRARMWRVQDADEHAGMTTGDR